MLKIWFLSSPDHASNMHPSRRLDSFFITLRSPAGIALSYVTVSIAWILLSDWLILGWAESGLVLTRLQMIKGGLYITVTSVLIYGLVRRSQQSFQKANTQLQEERAILESIFSAVPDTFYAFDREGDFRRWNSQLLKATGYSGEEIAAMHPLDFVTERHQNRVAEAITKVFTEHVPVTVEADMLTKAGQRTPYEFTGAELKDRDGQVLGLVGIGRDLRARRERERRFQAIFNQAYQFTALLSPDGTLIEVNETMLTFGGVDRAGVIDRPIWETYGLQRSEEVRKQVKADVQRAAAGYFVRHELKIQGKDRLATVDFSLKPVANDDQEVELLIAEGRDITTQKELERDNMEISRQERQWFAQELHDGLCQQLSNLSVRMASLQSSLSLDKAASERLGEIKALTERAIREARALSHGITPINFENECFLEALDQLTCETESAYQLPCTLNVSSEVHIEDSATAANLYRITQEALSNAIRHGKCSSIKVALAHEQSNLVLRIEDDGVGIEEGASMAEDTYGIGLETMQRRAQMIGACLEVRSGAECGTVVECKCPLTSDGTGRRQFEGRAKGEPRRGLEA